MPQRRPAAGASAAAILAGVPPRSRTLAQRLRRLVRETAPTAAERGYPGWRGIGYRDPQSGYVCGIFPQADHVRLVFERGVELPDPDGLLEGEGTQVRHVTIRRAADIRTRALRRLIGAALAQGAARRRAP
jgi:hypothetical protein